MSLAMKAIAVLSLGALLTLGCSGLSPARKRP
jgi:hypothetical protein